AVTHEGRLGDVVRVPVERTLDAARVAALVDPAGAVDGDDALVGVAAGDHAAAGRAAHAPHRAAAHTAGHHVARTAVRGRAARTAVHHRAAHRHPSAGAAALRLRAAVSDVGRTAARGATLRVRAAVG